MALSQLRLDPLSGRWVAVNTERARRLPDFNVSDSGFVKPDKNQCPFCEGGNDFERDNKGIRILPNLYPAFFGTEPFVVTHLSPVFTEAPSSGIHEVVVFGQDHNADLSKINDQYAISFMEKVRERLNEYSKMESLRYGQAIINQGKQAGASIEHPHAQLLGIPFVPKELIEEQAGFAKFAGGCLLCTTLETEERISYRVVDKSRSSLTICPFWSAVPFEVLIIPRDHSPHLHLHNPDDIREIGSDLKNALAKIRSVYDHVAYNVIFHTAPFRSNATFHWHIHIIPKLTTQAGFELGTGVSINVIAPEEASEILSAKEDGSNSRHVSLGYSNSQ
jgi:UDPglucose--hexose-1-phosphate uridylyltransferase